MKTLLSRLSSAHVIALIALVVAIGGTAWAAANVNSGDVIDNSLRSKDLKNGQAVKGIDVKDNTLSGNDVADGSINTPDLADGAVSTAKIAADAVNSGKVDNNSLTGADVDESSFGVVPQATKLANITVQRTDFTVADGADNGVTVVCAAGQQAIAGGVRNDDADTDGYVEVSRPVSGATEGPNDNGTFDGWRVFVYNQTSGQGGLAGNTLQASGWVVCVG
jgi:hypothetical protein